MHLKTLTRCLAGLALVAGLAASARADIAYGYAEQTISNVTITPATGTLTFSGAVVTSTTDSFTLNGSGTANSDPLDAKQSGVGALPPENTFIRTVTGNPPSGGSTLTRGDAVISNLGTPTVSASGVAESYLNGGAASATGNATLTGSVAFTPSATGTLAIQYSFANDIFVATSGLGAAAASYNFDFTIKDNATGLIVFQYGTTALSANTNLSLSAPPPAGEVIKSGTDTVTTSSLTAGTSYSLIFTDKTASSVVISVPEPGPMALAAVAGGLTFLTGAVRRFRRGAR